MKLSKRLEGIGNYVEENSIVADIGSDHGYIPLYLIKNQIAKKVIAGDISKNSLEKAADKVKEEGLDDLIDIRLGDGLDIILPFEVDSVILAGMGGLLIRDILDKDREKTSSISHFILQPNIAAGELRRYLYENSFEILAEDLVKEDNKFYEIIHAKKGKGFVSKEIYYEIGERLIEDRHPLLREYIDFKIGLMEGILEEISGVDTEKTMARQKELNENIRDLREVLVEIEGN